MAVAMVSGIRCWGPCPPSTATMTISPPAIVRSWVGDDRFHQLRGRSARRGGFGADGDRVLTNAAARRIGSNGVTPRASGGDAEASDVRRIG